jgi:glycerol-3-phosphate dehydrogenase
LIADDSAEPHLIAIYGGKLTAYRATAQRVVEFAKRSLPSARVRGRTDELPLTV